MRVWFHRYALVPKRPLGGIARAGAREGALLRFGDGFADLHPWPELGDPPLDVQLGMLSRGETTAQIIASRTLAEADANARRRGVSLFHGLTIPQSHWPGRNPPPEFDTAKVKGAEGLPDGVRLRLDFNSTLSPESFVALATALPRERIDFVEDPCAYDAATWLELSRSGIPLALDRAAGERHVEARCGLFTHVLYDGDPFLDAVRGDGARLLPPDGTGVGFDGLLERIPWKALA
jgi:O-succinylbenzoate synthase